MAANFRIIHRSADDCSIHRRTWEEVVVGFVLGILLFVVTGMADAAEKEITIGTVEDVVLLPWGVKMPARIDTGATKSSLDAQELSIEKDMVNFRLPEKYGGLRVRLPIHEWRHVRTSQGLKKRPVVEIEVCIGPKRLRTLIALDNRTAVTYPFLVGRNILKGNFVVDVKRKRIAPPKCDIPAP
jgi:hypothetical protein